MEEQNTDTVNEMHVTVDGVQTMLSELPEEVQQKVRLVEIWKREQQLEHAKSQRAINHLSDEIVGAIREFRNAPVEEVVEEPAMEEPVADPAVEGGE